MPPPFNIDNTSPADAALISAFPNNERTSRTLIEEWLSFISDPTTGLIRESVLPAAAETFPAGTKAIFVQTAAPAGWTKDVTHNNKALRIVNGTASTGGTVAFTTAFASKSVAGSISNTTATGSISSVSVTGTTQTTTQGGSISSTTATGTISSVTDTGTVGSHALTTAELPSHTHGATGLTFTGSALAAHSHTMSFTTTGSGGAPQIVDSNGSGGFTEATSSVSAGTPSGTIGGSTASTGSGTAHSHSLTMNSHNHTFTGTSHTHTYTGVAHDHDFTSALHSHTFTGTSHGHTFTGTAIDLAVQYVDVIIATKN